MTAPAHQGRNRSGTQGGHGTLGAARPRRIHRVLARPFVSPIIVEEQCLRGIHQ